MAEYIGWIDSEYNIILDHNQEIVRCRDCERFDDRWAYCNYFMEDIEPDGFCKWGEHK